MFRSILYAQLTCTGLIPADAGKTSRFGDFGWGTAGSSPLTQGKPHGKHPRRHRGRRIPAHTGKTRLSGRRWRRRGAHPRSRGENRSVATPIRSLVGSSPLTQGKPCGLVRGPHAPGLIPAHAGKTPRWCPPRRGARVHPRSRGENYFAACLDCGVMGSSPLTRGKRLAAGMTRRGWWAHPRSRGENSTSTVKPRPDPGSSPLTRGKPLLLISLV